MRGKHTGRQQKRAPASSTQSMSTICGRTPGDADSGESAMSLLRWLAERPGDVFRLLFRPVAVTVTLYPAEFPR